MQMISLKLILRNKNGGTMKKEDAKKICTDPFGAYTGRPKDPEDKPVQDADDL